VNLRILVLIGLSDILQDTQTAKNRNLCIKAVFIYFGVGSIWLVW
jgi:hypothetical protein